jgi:hypothetical protein
MAAGAVVVDTKGKGKTKKGLLRQPFFIGDHSPFIAARFDFTCCRA